MAPVFLTENVSDNGEARAVGTSKEHLKLGIIHEEEPFKAYPAIAFQQGDFYDYIRSGDSFDICYSIDENNFRNKSTIQLNIKDIKINKRD